MRPIAFLSLVVAIGLISLAGCVQTTTAPTAAPSDTTAAQTAQPQPAHSDSNQVLASIYSGLSTPTPAPSLVRGEQVTRRVGAVNLYGEIPGVDRNLPNDAMANIRQLTFSREGADFDIAIDPTGQTVVYASTRHRPTADLYIQKVNGSTSTQFTRDLAEDRMPAFSPDGTHIAFCSDRTGNWDIYVQRLDGGRPIQITNEPDHELHPSWSADGTQLAFCAMGKSGQWEVVVVDVDNPGQRRFIGYGLFPEFSPDGKKILFQRARYRGTRWFSIWTVDYEDGEGKRPTEIAASTNAAVINPAWSPEGNRIVFATVVNPSVNPNGRPGAADLWVVNVDGTGRTRLTTDEYLNAQPAWSPDGRVYFVTDRSGSDNIWSIQPSKRTMIVDRPVDGQPDGTASVPTTP